MEVRFSLADILIMLGCVGLVVGAVYGVYALEMSYRQEQDELMAYQCWSRGQ